jgi:hypothetical protein|tara:strand:- start:141 stop:524 length:384 start_codon:yes stop_codon:yes gene_type:complete
MAGQLDNLFKNVAKSVVSQLGASLDHSITYTKKASPSYNTSTGALTTTDTTYNIDVPISFIRSEEETGQEMREAKLYITPDQIGDNQVDLDDEITLNFAGSNRIAQIVNVETKKGGQVYLFSILVRF